MKAFGRAVIIILVVGLFGGTAWYLYQKDQEEPVVIKETEPFVTNITLKTVATGAINPRKEIEIKPRVSGIIDEIFVEAGEMVEKGALIARIKVIPDMLSLNSAEARVEQAQIRLDQAQLDFDRVKPLYDDGVVPRTDFQAVDMGLRQSTSEMDAAKSNLQLVRDGITARAGEQTNTLIRSTVSGMILDVPIKQGNSVIESNTFNDGSTIALIADMQSMTFEGKVDESEVGKIKEGMELRLSIGAIEDVTFDAELEYISPKGIEDAGTIMFEIKAAVKLLEGHFVRAGYSANADIVLEVRDSVLAVEERIVQFSNDSAFVEVKTGDNAFEQRHIETGLSDGINIEVLSGISKNDILKDPG